MLQDRGLKKWQGFFMTEHTAIVKGIDWDNKKVERPVLDENQLEEINQYICDAMEFNQYLVFTIFDQGDLKLLMGKVHYIDQLKNELRILDKFEELHCVKFEDIVKVFIE